MKKPALIIVDAQNDYTKKGKFPLWNIDAPLENMIKMIKHAKKHNWKIVIIENHSKPRGGEEDFLVEDSWGAETIDSIKNILPSDASIVRKTFASSFANTDLAKVLEEAKVTDLYIGGWMTQHCVTHTALDKEVSKYQSATIIPDICTSISEAVHQIALSGFAPYIPMVITKDIIS